ncbi:MAG TPA: aspartate--tRNA(Asn) ligase [Candidatus Dojkabacteria bacterium]|nr:aspartate--tRNA(Asn) ligase [Candidatus Dojkabacteria bacterium]HQF36975.1 aspartate--tRNA(Asn) ligase [Candidatus Dojkabacteria bacterium]
MEGRISIKEMCENNGKPVKTAGWIDNIRNLGKICFVILRDGSGSTQLVIEDSKQIEKLNDCQIGTVISAEGTVQSNKDKYELLVSSISIITKVKDVSPLTYNKNEIDANQDTELDYRTLSLRNIRRQAIFKVQAQIINSFSNSLVKQGFMQFRSPVLMGAPSESGADVFEVNYFGKKAYLAQSPQIYKQIMVSAFEKVFTITPVFRAEKHNTSRHIMELTQLDAEMAFVDSYLDTMMVVEEVVKDIIHDLDENCKELFNLLNAEIPTLNKDEFPRFPVIKVNEAFKVIEERTGKSSKREELDVDPDDEKELCKWAKEEHNSEFVWLINFKKDKNFYTYNDPKFPDESLSFDLIFRGLEVLSGTHRIHEYDKLSSNMDKIGLNKNNYSHYLQAFQFGMPPECGFSFGLERLTQKMLGLNNIREATLFPTDQKRVAGQRI